MQQWQLFCPTSLMADAQHWVSAMQSIALDCQCYPLDVPSHHKWLKQQQHPVLLLDEQGLWLVAMGLKMQPNWIGQVPRLRKASTKNELLARACGFDGSTNTTNTEVLDATAGLGHDALLMAWFGAKVTLLERHPILYLLLQSAKQKLQQYATQHGYTRLNHALNAITLVYTSAESYLTPVISSNTFIYDLIYLDPMFSQGNKIEQKQAQIKKEMQLLHILLADDTDLGDHLLGLAQHHAKRVVVKRPRLAPPLANIPADHNWHGDACRFDAYFYR